MYFSYSPPGCISHILQGAFLRSRKLTGGVAEGIGSLLAAAAGFCVHRTPASLLPHLFNTAHHRCGRRSSYIRTLSFFTTGLYLTSLRFCIIDGLHQLPWLRFTEWRHIVAVTLMSQCHVLALVPSGNTPSWMNFSNPFLNCLTLFGF